MGTILYTKIENVFLYVSKPVREYLCSSPDIATSL